MRSDSDRAYKSRTRSRVPYKSVVIGFLSSTNVMQRARPNGVAPSVAKNKTKQKKNVGGAVKDAW